MLLLTVTPFYVAMTVALVIGLAMMTIHQRIENKVALGTGRVQALERAIRAHGNLVEYAPIVLVLMVTLELNGLPHWQLHLFGMAFIAARLSHAYGLVKGRAGGINPRSVGALSTMIILMAMTGLTLIQLIR